MDTLDGSEWDVVIVGTGLPQSLLALALSRSGKRILHIDHNAYYGGDEAALSLSEAETWATVHAAADSNRFSHARISKPEHDDAVPKLSHARAYSLCLAPQLIYSRSNLLPVLVSSRTHSQLEFQAIGSWFVVANLDVQPELVRVPNGREDIFQDTSFDLRSKRALMKFLRFVGNFEEELEKWQADAEIAFSTFLEEKFGLPAAAHGPLMALTLVPEAPEETQVKYALPRIARHLRSIGLFGPGFSAVLPKWGGLAEVAQVACRSCAVGGGVYVLNKGIKKLEVGKEQTLTIELDEGDKITSGWVVQPGASGSLHGSTVLSKSISIISSPLTSLFPPTSEGGVTPAGAVVVYQPSDAKAPPVYFMVHATDSGECAAGQALLYASVALTHEEGYAYLDTAIQSLLQSITEPQKPEILWCMQYEQQAAPSTVSGDHLENRLELAALSLDLSLEDTVLEEVKVIWQKITGDSGEAFMKFAAREGADEEEDL